jgi:hypothetical protein
VIVCVEKPPLGKYKRTERVAELRVLPCMLLKPLLLTGETQYRVRVRCCALSYLFRIVNDLLKVFHDYGGKPLALVRLLFEG